MDTFIHLIFIASISNYGQKIFYLITLNQIILSVFLKDMYLAK